MKAGTDRALSLRPFSEPFSGLSGILSRCFRRPFASRSEGAIKAERKPTLPAPTASCPPNPIAFHSGAPTRETWVGFVYRVPRLSARIGVSPRPTRLAPVACLNTGSRARRLSWSSARGRAFVFCLLCTLGAGDGRPRAKQGWMPAGKSLSSGREPFRRKRNLSSIDFVSFLRGSCREWRACRRLEICSQLGSHDRQTDNNSGGKIGVG